MRWLSICTVLGALLLPAVNSRPCRPDRTTDLLTTASSTETSMSTGVPTSTESSTLSESSTLTESLATTLITSTRTETPTTSSDSSTDSSTSIASETSSTTSSAGVPVETNLIENGDFEGENLGVWQVRTVRFDTKPGRAISGTRYASSLFSLQNQEGSGGNSLNQTINGLDTDRLYRLSFSGAVFGLPVLGTAECSIFGLANGKQFKEWKIQVDSPGSYQTYTTELIVNNEDVTLELRLRCTTDKKVTIEFGMEDVVLEDIGDIVEVLPPLEP
ncbi:hypothetical protein FZEAL_5659 [Fusarium zealandicum]|uniref:CBM-cenC domain-containing protein n=1 Tax=Fusarium zealandicum TaxID=1053134 RepID=A0A8H4UJF6_9HYPO|nr:hypothetical protein FZEAL_5659 [Fusarium zealandicum]